jgi:thiol-disulfide isomerase/thioredoxin
MSRAIGLLLLQVAAANAGLVGDVRSAIAMQDLARAESILRAHQASQGTTPEGLEALSWLGRGALEAKSYDKAEAYAAETQKLTLQQLKGKNLDADRHLPKALGASIEVQANVLKARGQRAEAVAFLQRELSNWRDTSIRTRIQKNINLLTLEGKPAPKLDVSRWLTGAPDASRWKGRPTLLFFWAHWCGDCKAEIPVIGAIMSAYGPKGLALVAPTQRYGYAAGGEDATPENEQRYIEEVWRQYYAPLGDTPVPVSEENFRNYGASTTPTLVLLDRNGVVKMYHPGAISYQELAARVGALFNVASTN